jgi:hypothetical protein
LCKGILRKEMYLCVKSVAVRNVIAKWIEWDRVDSRPVFSTLNPRESLAYQFAHSAQYRVVLGSRLKRDLLSHKS